MGVHKGYVPWNKGKKGVMPTSWNKGMSKEKLLEHYKDKTFFEKGKIPWNKGLHERTNTGKTHFKKGNHPKTEFKKGCKPWSYIDGKWNKRKRKPIEAIGNWCDYNNIHRLPRYCIIHHIDQNPLNNNPDNLQLMTRDFHNELHNEFLKSTRKEVVNKII